MINRYAVIRGPALCVFKSGGITTKLLSEGDITIDLGITTADQDASFAGGPVATFRAGANPTVSFTPLGLTGYFGLINALASLPIGGTMVGALVDPDGAGAQPAAMSDNELIVQPLNAAEQQTRFYGVGISAAPGLTFATDKPLFDGALTFRATGKNNVAPNAAERLYKKEANTIGADGIGYDPAQLIRQAYTVTHAALNGGAAFDTMDGAKLNIGLKVNEHKSNSLGIYDLSFGGVTPVLTLTPIGISEADLLAAAKVQGAGSEIGAKLSAAGGNLDIAGTGVYCRLPLAGVRKAGLVRGSTADLISEVEFVGSVDVDNNGAVASRFYVGTVAPV